MTRRPFVSVVLLAGLALLLSLALTVVSIPMPLQKVVAHCLDNGGVCRSLWHAFRMAINPAIVVLMLAQFAYAAQRGITCLWRQVAATRAALDYLGIRDARAPTGTFATICRDLGLRGRVKVLTTNTPVALCHGLWQPCIVLSTGILDALQPDELQAVLRHERAHLRCRDPLRLLLARGFAAAQPYLPVLHELALALPLAQELAADRAVMRDGAREALSHALVALLDAGSATLPPILAAGMVTCLDQRIDQLTGAAVSLPRLSRNSLARTTVVLGAGLLLLSILVISKPA